MLLIFWYIYCDKWIDVFVKGKVYYSGKNRYFWLVKGKVLFLFYGIFDIFDYNIMEDLYDNELWKMFCIELMF